MLLQFISRAGLSLSASTKQVQLILLLQKESDKSNQTTIT